MSIEIAVTCCAETLSHYAAALRLQFRSIAGNLPAVAGPVAYRVAYSPDDRATTAVLDEFAALAMPAFRLLRQPMPRDELWCRTPARDLACRYTKSDILWLADIDYVVGPGTLDAIHAAWQSVRPAATMFYPREVMISRDHATGDRQLADGIITDVDFKPHGMDRAIAGLYILDGRFARATGYFRGTKWCGARPGVRPFVTTRDEVAYRKWMRAAGGSIAAVGPLPGLRRIRHSQHGYDPKFHAAG